MSIVVEMLLEVSRARRLEGVKAIGRVSHQEEATRGNMRQRILLCDSDVGQPSSYARQYLRL